MSIACPHHSEINGQPVCEIVADITGRPLAECHTNDSACAYCLGCGIAPQRPNPATASMAIGAADRTGDKTFASVILGRMTPHLRRSEPAPTVCILRGRPIRKVECKPCNAGAGGVMVDVYSCPKHGQCTLNATGLHPRTQACAGCPDRLEKSYQIEIRPTPPAVLEQIYARQNAARR